MNNYLCFGLKIESEIKCGKLLPWVRGTERPDVQITLGKVCIDKGTATLIDGYAWVRPRSCAIEIRGIARFEIENGRTIVIDPIGKFKDAEIQAYLMGTVFGSLMHQRGDIPLHVSAVMSDNGQSVAFAGLSGAGKSTIAAFLARERNIKILSDDVVRIQYPGYPVLQVSDGPRNFKVWKDARDWLKLPPSAGTQDFARQKKFHFPIAKEGCSISAELKHFVFLARSPDQSVKLRKVYGEDHLRIILSSIYRANIGAQIQGSQTLFKKSAEIALLTRGYILERPRSLADLGRGLAVLENEGLV